MLFQSIIILLSLAGFLTAAAVTPQVHRATVQAPANIENLSKRQSHNGKGTVFYQNGRAGSCGIVHDDSSYVAALSAQWMQSYNSPLCWKQIEVRNVGSTYNVGGTGNTIRATVADTCPADECDAEHVDFSIGAWNALTNNAPVGAIQIEWNFV